MSANASALIALALQFCPWQPEPIPELRILPDAQYEQLEAGWGLDYATRGAYWNGWVVLKASRATDRLLCHEWRHAVEGHWHD